MNETKQVTKSKSEHKYRVSVYLGKDNYETLSGMAAFLGIPLATATRILLETGVKLANKLDPINSEEIKRYGKSKI